MLFRSSKKVKIRKTRKRKVRKDWNCKGKTKRGSKLALIYAEKVKSKLEKRFLNKIEIKKIVTTGDENQKDRLSNLGGKGLFSKKIENELLNNEIL